MTNLRSNVWAYVLAALCSTAVTVSAFATTYPQPVINGFSPTKGGAGATVTLAGTGFTGANEIWVGSLHGVIPSVLSDTQVQFKIPSGTTGGQLAILNPQHAAFSSGDLTVTASASPTPTPSASPTPKPSVTPTPTPSATSTSGPGKLSIRSSGSQLLDASGNVVQLRGASVSGLESVAIQGWDPADPTGAGAGQAGGPNWAAMKSWKLNVVRLPLNEASWLGYTCTDSGGAVHNPDPGSNYKATVQSMVNNATANGFYVILDLHWTAPGANCPMLQTQMADADHSIAFWTSVATAYKGYGNVMFELFNEPFFNFDFSGNAWTSMMFGTGGSFTGFPFTGNNGSWVNKSLDWQVGSYQAMLNAVRATGAHNLVLVGNMQYTQDLSGWLANMPEDSLGQIAATWHAYPTFGTTWGTAAYAQPNYSPEVFTEAEAILAAGHPVIITETGDHDTAGTVGAPLVSTVTSWADKYGVSVIGWCWDVWSDADNVLIKDVNGTPTDGYGEFFHSWTVNHK